MKISLFKPDARKSAKKR